MDKTLFNLHDFILLLTAFESLAIVIFLLVSKKIKTIGILLLIAFFTIRASISLHELILWGSTFRYWVLDLSPNLFFVFNFSYWLDGPLIYLYVCSLLQPNYKLRPLSLLHFAPAVLFIGYLFSSFYLLPIADKKELISTYTFADLSFVSIDFLAKAFRIFYLAAAIKLLQNNASLAKDSVPTPPWLLQVLIAFTAILGWELLLSAIKIYHSVWGITYYDVVEIIGLSDYYMLFALTNVVVFLAVTHFSTNEQQKKKIVNKEPINMDYVEKLEAAMEQDKLFLNPNLSFERMAEKVDIPIKDLSATINRHYQINFYEFINNYRINEAKRLLEDPKQDHRSITEIFYDAGFNSKSVYNTLFKKKFNMTPSQYRKSIALAERQAN